MSEAFDAKLVGVAASVFLVVVTMWVLHSHYFIGLFEAVLGVALSIVVAAFFVTSLIESNYEDVLEKTS